MSGLIINSYALGGGMTFKRMLEVLGLTAGWAGYYDAGDITSWPGSGQRFINGTGGTINDLALGASLNSDSNEPTFVGVPGQAGADARFQSDGNDYFSPAGSMTFDDGFHKNNATFTAIGIVYLPSISFLTQFSASLLDNTQSGHPGTALRLSGTGFDQQMRLQLLRNNGSENQTISSGFAAWRTGWNFVAWVVNEGAGAGGSLFYLNGVEELFDATAVSPSSANPGVPPQFFSSWDNGSGVAIMAFRTSTLTLQNLDDLYALVKGSRFTTLP